MSERREIYLDWNAATVPDEAVLEAVLRAQRDLWPNPGSQHRAGRRARAAVEDAREKVAALLGVPPGCVTFTASGTEALNLVARGLVSLERRRSSAKRPHILASAVEHKALLEPLAALDRSGEALVELVPVDENGVVSPQELARRIRVKETLFAAVIAAQNETGALQPIDEIARETTRAQVPLVVDAAQALGRLGRDFRQAGWDYLVISAHKLRAPRGAAALVRRRERASPDAILLGGGQELGHRAGTEDVAAIVGLGEACARLASIDREKLERELRARQAPFEKRLLELLPLAKIAAERAPRLPQTTTILLEGARSEDLLAALDLAGVEAGAGSACSSGALEASHVLAAMGVPASLARGAVRLSFGETTSEADLLEAAELVAEIARRHASAHGPG